LEATVGAQRQNVHEVADNLIEQQRTNAEPLYEAARPLPITNPGTIQEVAQLMEIPVFQAAMERGGQIAAVERRPFVQGVPLTVGQLDYMKRGLDAVIESRSNGASAISRTEGRAFRNRLNE
jgi:hypothetical protein